MFALTSCGTTTTSNNTIDSNLMEKVLESKTFDIPITSIIYNDNSKSNLKIGGTLSNNGNITSTIPLNKGDVGEYYIRVRPSIIAVSLPYSGKSRSNSLAYNSSTVVTKNFSSSDIVYTITKRDDAKEVTIDIKEPTNELKKIIINIDRFGTALVTASKIQGQNVKYDGYISN